ncbi:MAG: hypothetical protein HYU26_12715 [Candidatus Rokubacteria bacterium]|nr:hypothetical protein [Candidatus Rokubacteria bacterium]
MSARLPYLATSLVLLAVGFGYALTQGRADRPAPPRPAGVAVAPRVPPPRPLPTARELLDRRAALSLSEEQTRRLEVLAREWSSESARLEAELQAATAEFSRFMTEAQAGRGASLQEIQRRSADAGELGAWVREQRRLHGEAAAGLLADWQRAKLVQEASGVPVGGGR